MTRSNFLSSTIGLPWAWKDRHCWEFAGHVQSALFSRVLPHIDIPEDPDWRWMVAEVGRHPERGNWTEVPCGTNGIVRADDGALVLLGRLNHPGHVGVWLKPEQRVIHCDRHNGVCLETTSALRAQGWKKQLFFEPR